MRATPCHASTFGRTPLATLLAVLTLASVRVGRVRVGAVGETTISELAAGGRLTIPYPSRV